MNCPNCSHEVELERDTQFCPGCGLNIENHLEKTEHEKVIDKGIEIKQCSRCQCAFDLENGAQFCPGCGLDIQAALVKNTDKVNECPQCQVVVDSENNARFCSECGFEIYTNNKMVFENDSNKEKSEFQALDWIKKTGNQLVSYTQEQIKNAEQQRILNEELAEENRAKWIVQELAENIQLATRNIPLELRESLLPQIDKLSELDSQVLYRSLANKSVSKNDLLMALNNTPKEYREQISSILDTLNPLEKEVTEVIANERPISNHSVTPDFKMHKKGTWINWGIFLSGLLVVYIIGTVILPGLGGIFHIGGEAFLVGFIIVSVINAIYYLPSLIYHASTGGKIVMFIINSILGVTVIGWIFLLVFSISRNSNEKRSQELMHYIKHK